MKRALAMACVAALAAFGVLASSGNAEPRASRVFDGTYVCTNTAKNGVRRIEASARRGFRERPAVWRWHSYVGVSNLGGPLVSLPPNDVGLPGGVSDLNWAFGGGAGLSPAQYQPSDPVFKTSASYTTRRACTRSSARIALAPAGLDGGAASYFTDEYQCDAPRRVWLRFRVVFGTRASFAPNRYTGALRTLRAIAPVREVKIAMRTPGGRPFLYLEALGSGKARIFATRSCT